MMNISFKGAENLTVLKKKCPPIQGRTCDVDIEKVVLKFDLNDRGTSDLADFNKTLERLRPCYRLNSVNKERSNHIRLECSTMKGMNLKGSVFKLNDYQLMLDEDQILPMFTFLASVTRRIAESGECSSAQRDVINYVNNKMVKEVGKYINRTG